MRRLLILAAAALVVASQAASCLAGSLPAPSTGSRRPACSASATAPTPGPTPTRTRAAGRPAISSTCAGRSPPRSGPACAPNYVLVHAGERFESVHDGKVDILCDPSTVTIARREIVDFSIPTYLDGAGVLSRQNAPVQRFEDLADKRVGVLIGTTTERLLRHSLDALGSTPPWSRCATTATAWSWCRTPSSTPISPTAASSPPCCASGGRPGFALSKRYFSYETYALALPRDDSAFRLLVDKTLAALYRSGKIKAILAKTFGHEPLDRMLEAMFVINSLPEK